MSSFIKLVMQLVNVTTNSSCKHSQQLQVVPQGLSSGDRVDGGKTYDDFVHEGSVFHPIKGVLIPVDK